MMVDFVFSSLAFGIFKINRIKKSYSILLTFFLEFVNPEAYAI